MLNGMYSVTCIYAVPVDMTRMGSWSLLVKAEKHSINDTARVLKINVSMSNPNCDSSIIPDRACRASFIVP